VEKTLRSGIYLECPNKKKAAEEEVAPKKRAKKGAAAVVESAVACGYSKRIGDAPATPTAETHGPVVETVAAEPAAKKAAKKGGKKVLQSA
jgi:DNA topoisomerase-1